ncbi:MAG TPA: rhodanese-like domain-containing protein [Kofleriaceae bacterium]|nr:rhodanese-like domain-containing protein [Kofleriaceae bacterium]
MSKIPSLVSSSWLAGNLSGSDLRILDATVQITPTFQVSSGRKDWELAHVPGAAHADLLALSDPSAPPFMFRMPSIERFAAFMGELGIGDGTRVVLYDARENMWAARLWWMLRSAGFDDAGILDGGWTTWRLENRPTCAVPCRYPPASFTPRPRAGIIVDKHEVLAAMRDPDTRIVSALGKRSHRGDINEYGRPGHIPGAANVSAWTLIDRATQRYRPEAELRTLFGSLLGATRVITYCGGGIASSSDAFVLHLLGHPNVAVYMGGLLEWCADPAMPMELGTGATNAGLARA